MITSSRCWSVVPPPLSPILQTFLTEPASLTKRLQATGHPFAITVLQQGPSDSLAGEAHCLGLSGQSMLYAREVLLSLDDRAVVYARSVIRLNCPHWQGVLERGNRSLGSSLFGGLSGLQRGSLEYQLLNRDHPLARHIASLHSADYYPARRCYFSLQQAPLLVCELLLPALGNYL
ncbi:chorismate lyase [Neisseriaceae bacterium TC5R-5]|nr:chorismate lyase [Neisseriaceae bacterium TC5R-5]